MGYKSMADCVVDLKRHKMLRQIDCEVDPNLDIGMIQRRVCESQGPALLFTKVKGCEFSMLGNLFGTLERTRFIFRDALKRIELLADLKIDPVQILRQPARLRYLPQALIHMFPHRVNGGPAVARQTLIRSLPQLKSWPDDGGAFITTL